MRIHQTAGSALLAVALAATATGRAQTAPASPEPGVLAVVVVEPLGERPDRIGDFNRIAIEFSKVFAQRKWPVQVAFERFAANAPAHGVELRMFYRGIHPETNIDQTFRAWMVLVDHGKKTDFGIVRFTYYPRPGETWDDTLGNVLHGAAVATADKIGPILFPAAGKPAG